MSGSVSLPASVAAAPQPEEDGAFSTSLHPAVGEAMTEGGIATDSDRPKEKQEEDNLSNFDTGLTHTSVEVLRMAAEARERSHEFLTAVPEQAHRDLLFSISFRAEPRSGPQGEGQEEEREEGREQQLHQGRIGSDSAAAARPSDVAMTPSPPHTQVWPAPHPPKPSCLPPSHSISRCFHHRL